MKKILITGITGFVGSHLADYALKKGVKVYGLKRWNLSRLRNVAHLLDKVEFFDCDLTDPIGIRKIIKKINPDWVFHLAAESFVSPSWDHPSHYMDVNFKGTVNILEAIRGANINPRFFIPGSGEEYGDIPENEIPINENTLIRPVNPYAVSKVAQDYIGYVYFRSYGLNVIRTRAFNHEGPRRDNVFGIPWYAYQIARIEAGKQKPIIRVGHIEDRRNFTHIKDLVEAYWLAITHCKPGELYLIGSDEKDHIYSYREILGMLIKMSKVGKVKIVQDPQFVRPTSVPRLIGDTSKFRKLTGWKPKIDVNTVLEDTLEYWRDFIKNDKY
ncbi:GDP-mannose 4,6-dehydratase [Candidatus Daviesbacteria bacterium RIFCSPHIGHO2_02_FULL_36_13]|uniref:GDP-mannose 4,6-dehydratase n=1 Tax=Candidatus Daviesbacteria bacterium RIFCSPHIGHO2_02_FULL_36_13 TaxID=1797768 RepID=A0A1F5JP95_9BACT|nr:MAG: GDP-mannose 4,6-dehydratase [Candidatus Daviesbacteria bacterium RIFCSPHIGHO2_02_FULL_36_13]